MSSSGPYLAASNSTVIDMHPIKPGSYRQRKHKLTPPIRSGQLPIPGNGVGLRQSPAANIDLAVRLGQDGGLVARMDAA